MQLTFILVEPKVPENIGASARALKTMGFSSLRLVSPCEYLDGKARWLAHGSYDILENASLYGSLKEAVADMDLVVGTTARYRLVKSDYISSSDLLPLLSKQAESTEKVALVFGREESGLTNEEIQICDITSAIPLKQDFPSLNLSQAVMIYAFQLSELPARLEYSSKQDPGEMSVRALKSKLGPILDIIGIKNSDALYGRIMERIALAGDGDIKLLHSAATALIKELGIKENR